MKIKNQYYIEATDKMIRGYRKFCDRYADKLAAMSVEQVVEIVSKSDAEKSFDLDFIDYGRKVVQRLIDEKHAGNATTTGWL